MAKEISRKNIENGYRLIGWSDFMKIVSEYANYYADELAFSVDEEKLGKLAKKLYPKLREADERDAKAYEKYLAELNLRNVFHRQAHNFRNDRKSRIDFMDESMNCSLTFRANKVIEEVGQDLGDASVIYIETRHILDAMNGSRSDSASSDLRRMLLKKEI